MGLSVMPYHSMCALIFWYVYKYPGGIAKVSGLCHNHLPEVKLLLLVFIKSLLLYYNIVLWMIFTTITDCVLSRWMSTYSFTYLPNTWPTSILIDDLTGHRWTKRFFGCSRHITATNLASKNQL